MYFLIPYNANKSVTIRIIDRPDS